MNIDDKIEKIAEWITHESDDTEGEVSCLLYNVYNSKMSGLSHNIDEAFEDVFNHINNNKLKGTK